VLLTGFVSPVRKILGIGDIELCLLPSPPTHNLSIFRGKEERDNKSGVNIFSFSEAAQYSFSAE